MLALGSRASSRTSRPSVCTTPRRPISCAWPAAAGAARRRGARASARRSRRCRAWAARPPTSFSTWRLARRNRGRHAYLPRRQPHRACPRAQYPASGHPDRHHAAAIQQGCAPLAVCTAATCAPRAPRTVPRASSATCANIRVRRRRARGAGCLASSSWRCSWEEGREPHAPAVTSTRGKYLPAPRGAKPAGSANSRR